MATLRNIKLDVLRGIAALSVVANHIMSHFNGFDGSLICNINFSLQNPLFMMVAGYAIIYSKPIVDISSLITYIRKRSILLLLPWIVWSSLRYILCDARPLVEYVKYTVNHMEGAYWFLISMWLMSLIYAVSAYIFKKYRNENHKYVFLTSSLSIIVIVMLFLFAYMTVGISFLGIKFTTYYMPFFLLGWIIAQLIVRDWSKHIILLKNILLCILLILYMVMIGKIDMGSVPDSMAYLRFISSISGCIVLYSAISSWTFDESNIVVKLFKWGGRNSLELYVVHYITMYFLTPSEATITSIDGFVEFIMYYIIVLIITALVIEIIKSNKLTKFVLFGRLK